MHSAPSRSRLSEMADNQFNVRKKKPNLNSIGATLRKCFGFLFDNAKGG